MAGGYAAPDTEKEAVLDLENLARRFGSLPALVTEDEDLRRRGAELCTTCLIGIGTIPFFMTVTRGMRLDLSRRLQLMRSFRFAVRGSVVAWARFWQTVPPPGWHDLFALTKRGEMKIEGDLHPFMAHLQVMKDLLALPRRLATRAWSQRFMAHKPKPPTMLQAGVYSGSAITCRRSRTKKPRIPPP